MNKYVKRIVIITIFLLLFVVGIIGLGDALSPLLVAFALSYLLFPIVEKLEQKGFGRRYTIPAIFVVILIFVIIIIGFSLPYLIHELKEFINDIPDIMVNIISKIEKISSNLGYPLDLSKNAVELYFKEHLPDSSSGVIQSISEGIKISFSSITEWLIGILNIFLIPLFFFYVINDFEKISKDFKSYIPKSILPKLEHYLGLTNNVLSGYIRGQLMVSLTLAFLYSIGLFMVGLKFGIVIGIISGLISIIPYAGFAIGFMAAIIMALANYTGPELLVGIVAVFVIVQTLEELVITPKLVGNKVGLSSFATMLVLIIGGNLFGVTGMLIAIPLAAICKTLISDLKDEYHKLDFYNESEAE